MRMSSTDDGSSYATCEHLSVIIAPGVGKRGAYRSTANHMRYLRDAVKSSIYDQFCLLWTDTLQCKRLSLHVTVHEINSDKQSCFPTT